jgi:long-subunit fatty acid transport protein
VNNWWTGLSPAEQKNPVNIAKYDAANRVLTTAGTFLDKLEGGLSTLGTSTIQYSLDKKLKDMWNFTLGTQYQFNRHWMIRAEYGFLGSRDQFIAGLQYRFGL